MHAGCARALATSIATVANRRRLADRSLITDRTIRSPVEAGNAFEIRNAVDYRLRAAATSALTVGAIALGPNFSRFPTRARPHAAPRRERHLMRAGGGAVSSAWSPLSRPKISSRVAPEVLPLVAGPY